MKTWARRSTSTRGGEDLMFPHHENEIAQSESRLANRSSHFWMHARFLLVEGEKMSKSLGNFYTASRPGTDGSQTVVDSVSAHVGAVSQAVELYLRRTDASCQCG